MPGSGDDLVIIVESLRHISANLEAMNSNIGTLADLLRAPRHHPRSSRQSREYDDGFDGDLDEDNAHTPHTRRQTLLPKRRDQSKLDLEVSKVIFLVTKRLLILTIPLERCTILGTKTNGALRPSAA